MNGSAANLRSAGLSLNTSVDRRSAPRIDHPFAAIVRGWDATGDRFTLEAVLDNLSASGLYFRLARPVELGATLFVVVRLTAAPSQSAAGPGVAIRGVVRRVDRRPGGVCGIAVAFKRHRFLYAGTG